VSEILNVWIVWIYILTRSFLAYALVIWSVIRGSMDLCLADLPCYVL